MVADNGRYEDVCGHVDHPGIQPDSVFASGCSDWSIVRVRREDDGPVYQPKIHSSKIRELYLIKQATGIPMTVLLDRAIAALVESYKVRNERKDIHGATTTGFSLTGRILYTKIDRTPMKLEALKLGCPQVLLMESIPAPTLLSRPETATPGMVLGWLFNFCLFGCHGF
jgi:hypothetical protein